LGAPAVFYSHAVAGESPAKAEAPPSPIVAQIGERTIREADVDQYIGREADAVKQKLYAIRREALSNMIDSLLLRQEAEKEHLSELDLLSRIAAGAAARPSPIDVERGWIQEYEALRPLGEVIGHYRVVLDREDRQRTEAIRKYLDALKEKAAVHISLVEPSSGLSVKPTLSTLGPASAGTTLTVFLDYECPFCSKFESNLSELLKEEPLRSGVAVRIKHLPLPMHATAFESAVGAVCAAQQGRFAEFHELLFALKDHSPEGLVRIAETAALRMPEYRSCVEGEAARREVLADMREASQNGIEGTPTLFLDGVPFTRTDSPQEIRKAVVAKLEAAQGARPGGAQ
jgi:protein-disulfide isomerase